MKGDRPEPIRWSCCGAALRITATPHDCPVIRKELAARVRGAAKKPNAVERKIAQALFG